MKWINKLEKILERKIIYRRVKSLLIILIVGIILIFCIEFIIKTKYFNFKYSPASDLFNQTIEDKK